MKCERQLCIKLYFRRQLNGSDYTDDGSTDHDHDHDQHHHQDQDQGQDQDQDQDQVRWKGFLCRRFAGDCQRCELHLAQAQYISL